MYADSDRPSSHAARFRMSEPAPTQFHVHNCRGSCQNLGARFSQTAGPWMQTSAEKAPKETKDWSLRMGKRVLKSFTVGANCDLRKPRQPLWKVGWQLIHPLQDIPRLQEASSRLDILCHATRHDQVRNTKCRMQRQDAEEKIDLVFSGDVAKRYSCMLSAVARSPLLDIGALLSEDQSWRIRPKGANKMCTFPYLIVKSMTLKGRRLCSSCLSHSRRLRGLSRLQQQVQEGLIL